MWWIGIIFNPWLGHYQSKGGKNISIVEGLAIVYNKELKSHEFNTKQKPTQELIFQSVEGED